MLKTGSSAKIKKREINLISRFFILASAFRCPNLTLILAFL